MARMSTTTETVYVRGTTSARFLAALEACMQGHALSGTRRLGNPLGSQPELADGARELVVARHGKWFAMASDRLDELAEWGRDLSKLLDRSVLTVLTWDGEASVVAERWKHGMSQYRLELLNEAYRGVDGTPRAKARVLWPWLPKSSRKSLLRHGIKLSTEIDDDEDNVFAALEDSVPALLGAIDAPRTYPWHASDSLVLEFTPVPTRRR